MSGLQIMHSLLVLAVGVLPLAWNSPVVVAQQAPPAAPPPAAPAPMQPVSILGTRLPDDWQKHPLAPALKMAYEGYRRISEEVDDYTCTLVKRERIDGELRDFEHIATKIRHERRSGDQVVVPFSVHMRFLAPQRVEGREVLFVEGANNGKMFARRGGTRFSSMAARIDPQGELAMRDNRYPITQVGILHLVRLLVQRAEQDLAHGEVDVKFFKGSKINGRSCVEIKVVHPVRREYFHYHMARILIDDELRVPIHYEAYDWPTQPGGEPPLTESYSYLNLKLNTGLKDADFDYRNPEYGFEYLMRPSASRGDEAEDRVGFADSPR